MFLLQTSTNRNTFQIVLVTDGTATFVILNYHQLTWTTDKTNGGNVYTGLGGKAATV